MANSIQRSLAVTGLVDFGGGAVAVDMLFGWMQGALCFPPDVRMVFKKMQLLGLSNLQRCG
jgi:hypothetical protein